MPAETNAAVGTGEALKWSAVVGALESFAGHDFLLFLLQLRRNNITIQAYGSQYRLSIWATRFCRSVIATSCDLGREDEPCRFPRPKFLDDYKRC